MINRIFVTLDVFEDDNGIIYFMPSNIPFSYWNWKQKTGTIIQLNDAVVKVNVNCYTYDDSHAEQLTLAYIWGRDNEVIGTCRLD